MPHFQILLDENMDRRVMSLLQPWITVGQIGHEVGKPGMLDEEIIPGLLLRLKRTTLVSQDERLYRSEHPHPGYCLLIVPEVSPEETAGLVRRLFRLPGFRTVKERMGKVIRLTPHKIRWKKLHQPKERTQNWPDTWLTYRRRFG